MRKPVLSSDLNLFTVYVITIIIILVTEVKCGTVVSNENHKHVVIAVPSKITEDQHENGGNEKFPSLSRTMAVLGSRIKKKIGDAHKSLFLPDSVKRVGQVQLVGGRKLQQLQHNNINHVNMKPWELNEKRSLDLKFRPHQPDITSEVRSGKLTLPVVEVGMAEEGGVSEIARTRTLAKKPTPMANTINPYTNGVAASFPPGIDPYDGFIKYAAENLDTPMGNLIDYHSLEHYYGPQHPLNPYKDKNKEEVSSTPRASASPYVDSFPYAGNNEVETSNSPPPPPPPPGPGPHGHGPPGPGFRSHHPRGPPGHHNHYPMSSMEHGVDMFHAPSPGEPKFRPEHHHHHPPHHHHNHPDPEDDEEYGQRPPHSTPMTPSDFPRRPPMNPYNNEPPDGDDEGETQANNPPPPDLSVFEEGPPPELLSEISQRPGGPGPGGPDPPASPFPTEGSNSPQPHPPHNQHIENDHQQQGLDGGDDSIWGILDLAQMLEKGQIPGSGVGDKDKVSNAATSSRNPSQTGRVVMPIFNRPPPPRMSPGSGEGGPFSSSPNKYDYDDNNENDNDEDGPPDDHDKRPHQHPHHPHLGHGGGDGPEGSQESFTDYAEESY